MAMARRWLLRTGQGVVAGVVLGVVIGRFGGLVLDGAASAYQSDPQASQPRDLDELARLYDEDQGDRQPPGGKPIDWSVVGPRDRRREARVKEL
jgi:hypothetical protein